jgi:hypothetical protein
VTPPVGAEEAVGEAGFPAPVAGGGGGGVGVLRGGAGGAAALGGGGGAGGGSLVSVEGCVDWAGEVGESSPSGSIKCMPL